MTAVTTTRDTMPSREGDLSIEGHGMEPIPESARYGAVTRSFTVWFTPNLVPAAFAIGVLAPVFGLGWWSGFLAILVGTAISSAVVGLLSTMGPRTGMAQIPAARMPFGKWIVVPGIINWLSTIAWDAINAFFGAFALNYLFGLAFPIGLAIVILCQAALSVVGYEAIHTFEKYAAVALFVLFAVVTAAALPKMDFGLANGKDFSLGACVLMTTISGSFNLGWALYASDYSRYLPSNTSAARIWLWTFLGIGISAAWIEALGLAVAGALGSNAPADATGQIYTVVGGAAIVGYLALIAIFFGTVAVNGCCFSIRSPRGSS